MRTDIALANSLIRKGLQPGECKSLPAGAPTGLSPRPHAGAKNGKSPGKSRLSATPAAALQAAVAEHVKLLRKNTQTNLTDEQRVAIGLRPRTLRGWWWWLRHFSPLAHLFRKLR